MSKMTRLMDLVEDALADILPDRVLSQEEFMLVVGAIPPGLWANLMSPDSSTSVELATLQIKEWIKTHIHTLLAKRN